MNIIILKVGALQTNCYILSHENNEAIIVDPGAEINKINKATKNFEIKGIYYTHSHPDHIGALKELELKYNLKGNDFSKNPFKMEIIPTPGHHDDSLTFYFPDDSLMLTGDFIFKNSIGRVDLYGSNVNDMIKSLELIKKYPEDTILYPGHGDKTILKDEIANFKFYF